MVMLALPPGSSLTLGRSLERSSLLIYALNYKTCPWGYYERSVTYVYGWAPLTQTWDRKWPHCSSCCDSLCWSNQGSSWLLRGETQQIHCTTISRSRYVKPQFANTKATECVSSFDKPIFYSNLVHSGINLCRISWATSDLLVTH